jgi:hypothetical protein
MGINLGRRLLTASILIAIVWGAGSYPPTWFLINCGIPLKAILEYSALMELILEYLH